MSLNFRCGHVRKVSLTKHLSQKALTHQNILHCRKTEKMREKYYNGDYLHPQQQILLFLVYKTMCTKLGCFVQSYVFLIFIGQASLLASE